MKDDNWQHFPIDRACLPMSWGTAYVGDISTDIQPGFASGEHNQEGNGIPHIRPMNVSRQGAIDLAEVKFVAGENPSRLLEGDVLFNNTNSPVLVGKTAPIRSTENWAFSNHMTRIRLNPGIDYRFLATELHYLWMVGYFRHRCVNHVNQASISSKALASSVPVVIPPSNEQCRIIAKIEELFSDLDAGVAALQRIKKWEEEQLAKFAAVEKTPPKGWKEKYVEPAAPDTSKLPSLPKGWCWIALGQVALFQNGRAFPSKAYADEGTRLLRPGNLFADGTVRWTDKNSRFMPNKWAENHPTYIVRGNELVMNLTAQSLADEFLGRTCRTDSDECCLLNQRLARITPFEGIDKHFTLYLLKSSAFRKFVNGLNTGSLIEHMFTSQLETCCLPLPPMAEQQAVVDEIERRFSVIEENETQVTANLKRAGRLRQSILKRAFEGKLVPQDSTDEAADKLLVRIRQERAKANGSVAPRAARRRANSRRKGKRTEQHHEQ